MSEIALLRARNQLAMAQIEAQVQYYIAVSQQETAPNYRKPCDYCRTLTTDTQSCPNCGAPK